MDELKSNSKAASFAVIQITAGMEEKLLRILSENGYNEISFANSNGELINTDENDTNSRSKVEKIDPDEEEIDVDVEETDTENSNQGTLIIDEKNNSQNAVSDENDSEQLDAIEKLKLESILSQQQKLQSILADNEKLAMFLEQQQKSMFENQKLESIPNPFDHQQQQQERASNMEFSSLTLPTVLLSEQKLQFPFSNPFLTLPFFHHYLPQNLRSPITAATVTAPASDVPFFQNHLVQDPNPTTIDPMTQIWPFTTTNFARSSNALGIGLSQNGGIQILDTPPSTPRNRSGGSSSNHSNESAGHQNGQPCLITGAKLRQRGKQLRRQERDSSSYASCRLCRNRILANRLSNLHNHVRRHAVLKQFHCCYCSYAHTEVAKVRLHMLHNHKDDRTQPLDKRNDDMEAAWSMLMKECFPSYA